MPANPERASRKPKAATLAFRTTQGRRKLLEAIQEEKGHADLSDTLREALDQYLERHIRETISPEAA